jgi:uncharacterized protein (TIGR02391 family)
MPVDMQAADLEWFINWESNVAMFLTETFGAKAVEEFSDVSDEPRLQDHSLYFKLVMGRRAKLRWLENLQLQIPFLQEAEINRQYLIQTTWNLIHPDIAELTRGRFESGHYADAAETALKYINRYVKETVKKATGNEYDGVDLMRRAFSVNNPIITIDDLSTENGRSIQQGYMEMFVGAMMGIRNPKAHDVITIDRERAIHFIFLASLLMDTVDIANKKYRYQNEL